MNETEHTVKMGKGADWIRFESSRDTDGVTVHNSKLESAIVTCADAAQRIGMLVLQGWRQL